MNMMSDADRFDMAEAATLLDATPGTLQQLLGNLQESWLDFQEEPQAWSPRMVMIHFIHNEQTNWITRAEVILSEDEPRRFPPFQQMPEEGSFEGALDVLLDQFSQLRQESLGTLQGFNLKPDDYEREGEHPALGTVTLGQLLSTWVVHDLNHLHQIAKSMAKRYTEAVGPWRENLAVLDI
jgi:hypothetical protein